MNLITDTGPVITKCKWMTVWDKELTSKQMNGNVKKRDRCRKKEEERIIRERVTKRGKILNENPQLSIACTISWWSIRFTNYITIIIHRYRISSNRTPRKAVGILTDTTATTTGKKKEFVLNNRYERTKMFENVNGFTHAIDSHRPLPSLPFHTYSICVS